MYDSYRNETLVWNRLKITNSCIHRGAGTPNLMHVRIVTWTHGTKRQNKGTVDFEVI